MALALYLLYLGCLLLSAIMALVNIKYLKSRQLLIFIPYLFLVFIQELIVFISLTFESFGSTALIYNVYRPVSACFYAVFFYFIPSNKPVRKLIQWMLLINLVFVAVIFLFIQSIKQYNSYLSLASGFVISCCGILFLFNYFNLDSLIEEKKWRPVVWISTGLVIFYPVVNIVFAFYFHILAVQATIFDTPLHQAVPRIMSIFMYGCFTYAFYLCKKEN